MVAMERVCLRCDKTFKSESAGNRICPTCQKNGKYKPINRAVAKLDYRRHNSTSGNMT